MGVGLANQFMSPAGSATSGVDWNQALGVFKALLFSPVVGFICAFGLLLLMKFAIKSKQLYDAPVGNKPPPLLIRGLLVLTCTGVSFAHGSNDGQKGMGLIMLILIGVAPTAYALNRTMSDAETPAFIATIQDATTILKAHATGATPPADAAAARVIVGDALKTKTVNSPAVFSAMGVLGERIVADVKNYGTLRTVPASATPNVRNDMYLTADATRVMKTDGFSSDEQGKLTAMSKALQNGTRFIPFWVKVAVALALGLGTMVGWKRIVVTVGEKIGKTHLTYAQGASAELVAMVTIGAADMYGLPVSTTHVLSSGVAGTMAANGSGLQWSTVRNMALAWVMTLPAAMVIAGSLFVILRHVF
jgi:PiT family inorganic phosphate transporter